MSPFFDEEPGGNGKVTMEVTISRRGTGVCGDGVEGGTTYLVKVSLVVTKVTFIGVQRQWLRVRVTPIYSSEV
jgi:hypothetical protein